MIEVLRTNDPVRLDYAMVLLKEAGCYPFVADRFMAAAEGGILAFERRVLVPDQYEDEARDVLQQLDRPFDPQPDDEVHGEDGSDP